MRTSRRAGAQQSARRWRRGLNLSNVMIWAKMMELLRRWLRAASALSAVAHLPTSGTWFLSLSAIRAGNPVGISRADGFSSKPIHGQYSPGRAAVALLFGPKPGSIWAGLVKDALRRLLQADDACPVPPSETTVPSFAKGTLTLGTIPLGLCSPSEHVLAYPAIRPLALVDDVLSDFSVLPARRRFPGFGRLGRIGIVTHFVCSCGNRYAGASYLTGRLYLKSGLREAPSRMPVPDSGSYLHRPVS
jgi:hypothetical protein